MNASGLTIYNLPTRPPNWDRVGVFYVSFAATWTTIVLAGMAFCWFNRDLPIIKVRGLPLAFGSVIFLHMYWILAQIVYPIGATMPVVAGYDFQYFVMGIWFPLGIALFHASNLRFLYIAKRQRTFAHPDLDRRMEKKGGCNGSGTSWLCRLRNIQYTTKVMAFIIAGIILQAALCAGMWVACKKYHPSFGIHGTEIKGATVPEQLVDLGRGWEWWPSVVWQLVWTWMVAPYLIWRSWGINDTMGWRTQTIGTCLAGLHATPMFIIASYVPVFIAKINMYFAPSQWIHLSTMFIEIFTVFIPCYQIIKLWIIRKQVEKSKNKWDAESDMSNTCTLAVSSRKSSATDIFVEKQQVNIIVSEIQPDRLLTMTALNRVLTEHPAPLQEFSAYNDFSGENIAFLTSVAKFKESFPNSQFKMGGEERIEVYNAALKIYIDYISPRDAEFPINVSHQLLKELEDIFEKPTRLLCGEAEDNPATPAFLFESPPSRQTNASSTTLRAMYTGAISENFNACVFDAAQAHIKDLVLTNTWPKFVKSMQKKKVESISSQETGGSGDSKMSAMTQITAFVRSLMR